MDPELKQLLLKEELRQSPFLKIGMGVCGEGMSGVKDTGIKTHF